MWKRWIYLLVVGAGLVLVTSVAATTGTVTDAVPAMVEPADGLEVTYLSHPPLALPQLRLGRRWRERRSMSCGSRAILHSTTR